MSEATADAQGAQGGEFKRGGGVVLAAAFGIGLGLSPLPFYTLAVFARPLAQEFGWDFGQIMFSLTIMTLAVFLMGPVVGIAADRFGARRVAIGSVVLFSLTFAGFALTNGSLPLFYANWAIMAALGAGTLPITWTRGVNSFFVANRGLALGLSLMATGLCGFVAPRLAEFLIQTQGWRVAYLAIAALPLLIALPIALLFFREAGRDGVAAIAAPQYGKTLREAVVDWRFWVLGVAFVPISLALGGPVPNMVAIMESKQFDRETAVGLLSFVGLSVIVGRVAGGWLIDRLWAPGVAFVMLSLPAISLLLLSQMDTLPYWLALSSVILIGVALGVEYDFMAYMVVRYFGMRAYAGIYGSLYGFFAMGAGFGPAVFGAVFAHQGTYDPVLLIAAVLTLIGSALLLTLGKYPTFKRDAA
ncbi:MAG: MFS transporter [Hyphomonadaceae bacterium]|nr:MFS transporter [Hyphomonadaceae bacterium]